jgi:aspartate aminotransferase-like enzyme
VQLERIAREGLEARFARHAAMRARTEAWTRDCAARAEGTGILAPEGARSPTVSAVTLPASIDGKALVKAVAARGFTIGGGYGSLASRSVRIGHMGDHTVEELERCLGVVEEAIVELTGR